MHEALVKEDPEGNLFISIPEDLEMKLTDRIDPTLGISGDIGVFHDSLERFHELFFDDYSNEDFKGNDLISKIEKGNEVNFVIKA